MIKGTVDLEDYEEDDEIPFVDDGVDVESPEAKTNYELCLNKIRDVTKSQSEFMLWPKVSLLSTVDTFIEVNR